MIPAIAYCASPGATWLLINASISPIIYYAHAPNIIIATVLAFYVLFQNRKGLANQVLFFTLMAFVTWVFFALVFWATNRSDVVMFSWLMDIYAEPLVYIGIFYLMHVLIDKQDLSFLMKVLLVLLYSPIIILAPTMLTLSGFDVTACLAIEGPVALYYTYFIEITMAISLLVFTARRLWSADSRGHRQEILILVTGAILFLVAFAWGNITGSFTSDWKLGLYGLFGAPVFVAFLVYSIVRFRTFNIKLIGAYALVAALVALIGAEYSFVRTTTNDILISITLVLTIIFGIALARSVKKEIEQREHIELIAKELEETNERQEGLIHFISHEVKGFLTKDMAAFAALDEGDLGQIPDAPREFVKRSLAETRNSVGSVMDLLKASNLKKGTIEYKLEKFDLSALARAAVEKEKPIAEKKGLALSFTGEDGLTMTGDAVEIGDHVMRNLIDNAINYTQQGSIDVSLKHEGNNYIFAVKDTGIGITNEDKQRLFTEGGHGKDSQRTNVHSTGYGLFIAKNIVLAHNGTIRAESEGSGNGSTFTVELPA